MKGISNSQKEYKNLIYHLYQYLKSYGKDLHGNFLVYKESVKEKGIKEESFFKRDVLKALKKGGYSKYLEKQYEENDIVGYTFTVNYKKSEPIIEEVYLHLIEKLPPQREHTKLISVFNKIFFLFCLFYVAFHKIEFKGWLVKMFERGVGPVLPFPQWVSELVLRILIMLTEYSTFFALISLIIVLWEFSSYFRSKSERINLKHVEINEDIFSQIFLRKHENEK